MSRKMGKEEEMGGKVETEERRSGNVGGRGRSETRRSGNERRR